MLPSRATRPLAAGALAAVATFTAYGCTFGNLADYSIQQCDPGAASQAADVCDRLNGSDHAYCTPYQCDPSTKRCVQRPRDDDRDGDPKAACGGGDCDDDDAAISSLRVGTPAPLAGATLPPDEAKYGLTTDGGDAPLLAFASKVGSGECLSVAKADIASTTSLGACQLLSTNYTTLPTQPYARKVGDASFAAAFVSLSGCAAGALGFAYSDKVALATCGAGVARPALAVRDTSRAVVAWYEVPAASRASPLDDCASATPTALRLLAIDSIAAPSVTTATGTLSTTATSMQPPALLVRGGSVFVASPDGDAAKIWALDATLAPATSYGLAGMPSARSTAMAAHQLTDGRWRVAVVAELGCDKQVIRLSIVDFDPSALAFTSVVDAEVAAASGSYQWQPTIAWVEKRQRWLVTWLTPGPKPFARFMGDDGTAGAPSFALASGALTAESLSTGHAALVASSAGGQQLLDSPVRCP